MISPSVHSSLYGVSSAKINVHFIDVESYKQLSIQVFMFQQIHKQHTSRPPLQCNYNAMMEIVACRLTNYIYLKVDLLGPSLKKIFITRWPSNENIGPKTLQIPKTHLVDLSIKPH
jgi:hypothetical protein